MTKRKRLRSIPVQVYLSSDEHAALLRKCAERGCNPSELVRRWINRQPKPRPHDTAKKKAIFTEDPRQLTITPTKSCADTER